MPGTSSPFSPPADLVPEPLRDTARVTARVLERARIWVEHESPSGNAAMLAAMADLVAEDFQAVGGEVERLAAPGWGVNLTVRIPGERTAERPVLVLGHVDTVHPAGTIERQPFRVVDGRAEGPGIYDMKAPVAVLVETLAAFLAVGGRPRRPLEVLVTCDEERGSHASLPHIEAAARRAALVLVLEPPLPGGGVKTARKGVAAYHLRAFGRAAHAGIEPDRGVSATAELAHQIRRLLDLADPAAGTTLNVGRIEGGTAVNVVAARAEAVIDVRFASEAEAARVDAGLRALRPILPDARLELERTDTRPPLERTAAVVELYEHARGIAASLGIELGEGMTGGGSDGCLTAALGVPTLDGLGVDGGGAHSTDEHVLVTDLPRRAALYYRLLETF